MREITVRDLRAATVERLHEWVPCVVVADGKPVAVLVGPHDARQRGKAAHDALQATAKSPKREREPVHDAHQAIKATHDARQREVKPEPHAVLPLSKAAQAAGHMGR